MESNYYISYFIAQQKRGGKSTLQVPKSVNVEPLFGSSVVKDSHLEQQQQAISAFMEKHAPNTAQVLETFTETPENLKAQEWPQLTKALEACHAKGATLLIAELGTLTTNEAFTKILLNTDVPFCCCDQLFVNPTILEALHKHAQVQKKYHGTRIREGIEASSLKSGNPYAAIVIKEVNKPKIDTAIIFAFLLQPIIVDYRRKGYSQRQMVKSLNEEGFSAPEGGKWVLSQLQKVLDRVKINEITQELSGIIKDCQSKNMTLEEISNILNSKGISPIKRSEWDVNQVKKLVERSEQIQEITWINQFILDFLPILHAYKRSNTNPIDILSNLDELGVNIKSSREEAAA